MYRKQQVPPQMFSMLGMQQQPQMDPRLMSLLGGGMGPKMMPSPQLPEYGDINHDPADGNTGGGYGGGDNGGDTGNDDNKDHKPGQYKLKAPPIQWAFPEYTQKWAFDLPRIPKDQRIPTGGKK